MRPLVEQQLANAEILVVGGQPYAFGLRWTSATSRSTLEEEAKAAAITEAANYVVIHRPYNQFGLASIADAPTGIRRWLYRPRSGVSTIALTAGAATLAAFPLDDDRWLVLAINRKGILPDGDVIVADAEQAKARIEALIAQSPTTWRKKFVPEDWGIAESKTVNPADLLSRSGAPRLAPLWLLANRFRLRLGFAALGIFLTIVAMAAFRLATMAPPVVDLPFQPPKPVAALWIPAPLALDRCLSALRDAQRYEAVPGWLPAKYSCLAGESVAVEFTRIWNGQISAIRGLLPQAQLSDDGRSAVLALPLATLPRVSAIGPFATRQQYQLVALDLSQRLNGSFTLQAARKPLPGEADTTTSNQTWKLFAWTYQTRAPALVWAGAIARLGSIGIDTVIYSPADNLWQLTGSLYASP